MCLVVEFEGIVGVGEVLLGLVLFLGIGRDPVEKLCSVARVFGVSRLIIFESFVVALFSSSAALSPRQAPSPDNYLR